MLHLTTEQERTSALKNHHRFNLRLAVTNAIRYFPLLMNLISRELKKKYRNSVLGYAWCVLNPLLVMLIMNFVFSHMFSNSIDNFPVYLFAGRMMFSFITDSTTNLSRSIVLNGSLMRKTRIPYYIFPLATFFTSVVNFLFSLLAFAFVLLITGTPVTIHILAFPLTLLSMFLFALGLGMFLGMANTFLRDVHYAYAVFITAWLYVSPIFYPMESLPASLQFIITNFNPAYFYMQQSRLIFLHHMWPSGTILLQGFVCGLLFMALGLYSYSRSKDKLILYV